MSIESKLRTFIVEELLEEGHAEADPLTADAVDSLGLEQLVEYVEIEFGVSIHSEEMVRENFGSLTALVALIEFKLARDPTDA